MTGRITDETDINFMWTETVQYEFTGTVGDLPKALRDALIGRPSDSVDELYDAPFTDLLDSDDLRSASDIADQTFDCLDDIDLYEEH